MLCLFRTRHALGVQRGERTSRLCDRRAFAISCWQAGRLAGSCIAEIEGGEAVGDEAVRGWQRQPRFQPLRLRTPQHSLARVCEGSLRTTAPCCATVFSTPLMTGWLCASSACAALPVRFTCRPLSPARHCGLLFLRQVDFCSKTHAACLLHDLDMLAPCVDAINQECTRRSGLFCRSPRW